MVKRYFRPLICAICVAISTLLGAGNIPAYIAAAELPIETEDGVQDLSETETEAAAADVGTETPQTEAVTEPATETQTEPATEQMPDETAVPISAEVPAAVAESEDQGNGQDETGETGPDGETDGTEGSETDGPGPETAKSTPAVLAFSKQSYNIGDDIEISVDKYADANAASSTLTFDIPNAMKFKGITSKPAFADRTAKIQYKDGDGTWQDYTGEAEASNIKGLRIQIENDGDKAGIKQTDRMVVKFEAVNRIDADILLETKAIRTGGTGTEVTETTTARAHIIGEVADVEMTQDPEAPVKGDEVRQETKAVYKMDADTVLTYTVDPGVDLLGMEFGADSMFIGGTAVVTSSSGDTEAEITENLDLKAYSGITSVKLMPKNKAEKGVVNTFTAILSIREYMDAYTNKLSIVAGPEDNQVASEYSKAFKIDYNSMEKPALSYEGGMVPFGEDFKIDLSGMGIHSFKDVESLDYSIMTPEFATIREIKLPGLTGASSVSVYVQEGEGETLLGGFKPGDIVTVDKNGISGIRFSFGMESNDLTVTQPGSLVLASLNKKNRQNYYAFRASMRAKTTDTELNSVSEILSVTFELYQKTDETEKNAPTNPPVPTPPPNSPVTVTPPADNEPSEYDRLKEEEEKKRQSIIDKTLENDKATKEKQKELLAKRIASIRSSAVSAAGGEDSAATKAAESNFEGWLVKPIDESLIENLVPAGINPIDEGLVENIIPADA